MTPYDYIASSGSVFENTLPELKSAILFRNLNGTEKTFTNFLSRYFDWVTPASAGLGDIFAGGAVETGDQIINDLANLLSNEERITVRQAAKTQNNDAGQRSRDTRGNNQEPAGAQRSDSQEPAKPDAPNPGQTTNQPVY